MAEYDFVAIGGGNTGLSAAYRVARAGKKVALVDKGPVGGLCSLAGCNPKKVFVRATEVLDEVRRAGEHGISTGPVSIDWSRVWRRKTRFTDPVPAQTEESLKSRGIELIEGEARFVGAETVTVGDRTIRAKGFIVATGSHPRALTIPGAEFLKTTDDILELQQPPKRMVILGAGVVAFEFAHVFARLGTKVTMLLRGTRALSDFDQDFIDHVARFTESLGVRFTRNTDVRSVLPSTDGLRVEASAGGEVLSIDADFVLNAAGRVSAVEALDVARAGVEASAKGIVVDEFLRSPGNRRVFAGGDAHGAWQLSPVASYEGRVIARNFLEGDVEKADYSVIPRAVFTVPPVASVGMTEEAARRAGREIDVAAHDMTNWKVYAISGEPIARSKVVTEKGTGQVLGAQLFGPGAADLIHVFALAMHTRISAKELKSFVYVYPTFTSALESTLP